jgi:nicotinate phosphoribosyltransferase
MRNLVKNTVLLVDLYELTMAQSYFIHKPDTRATFELFVRNLGKKRSFLLAAGLEDILDYIKNLRFSDEHINYLKKQKLFSDKFLKYLKNFRFNGDIWAMPEGTICFANEPVLRVTANIIEAQILESFCLNTINLQTMIASKAARVVLAAQGRGVFDFALRRTQGTDAAIKAARSSYLAGCGGTSNVLAGLKFNIPVVGTMAHSFVMAFDTEVESFCAYSRVFPDKTTLLVDTYDTKKGIENAMRIGRFLKEKGHRLMAIRLDSGDLVTLSKMARKMLNSAGLEYVKIFASGNLDEYKIDALLKKGAQIDNFGVGTHMGVSSDAPYLDVIYKLSEISHHDGRFLPTMKLSQGKVTYPGRKQVFRMKDKSGKYVKDTLALEDEKVKGEPLLIKVVSKGKIIYQAPPLIELRKRATLNLLGLPAKFKQVYSKGNYPVVISPKLKKLTLSLACDLERKQTEDIGHG